MGRIIDDDDIADIREGMRIKEEYEKLKESKQLRQQISEQDLKERWARIEISLEKSRVEALQNASIEVLMAIAKEPAQLQTLYKTARLRTLAGLPPEKAVVLMMEDKAIPLDIAKELITTIYESGKTSHYERLIAELKEARKIGEDAYEKNLQRLVDFFKDVLGTVNIISGKGPSLASQVPFSFCPSCGKPVQPDFKFCLKCGKSL